MKMKLRPLFQALDENTSPAFWITTGVVSIGFLGMLDAVSGNEITLSLFYLLPIVTVTWQVNQRAGLFMSFISALTLLVAEIMAGQTYSHPIIYVLNTLVRSVFYVVFTYLVAELQRSQRDERLAARTDFVTGAVNARYFNELLHMEIARLRRYPHPFTVVFMDIDNFKLVNDLFGHQIGDNVLRCITNELKVHLRKTDIVARVGGDEFALLLPSARQPEAEVVLSKVHAHLRETMRRKNWPVTFSMGAVTCITPPYAAEQLVNLADELMYTVKKSTKNDVRFITWGNGAYMKY